jgi:HEAT repeat protein
LPVASFGKTGDPEAGWELIEALESVDPSVRAIARLLLVDKGADSLLLLEDALVTGAINPATASECMAEIMRNRQVPQAARQITSRHLFDVLLC